MIQIDVVMPRLFAEGSSDLQIQLALEKGSLTALVGPSGSGKTTLLRLVAGLEIPRQGRILVDEQVWLNTEQNINRSPQQRSIGYVFQDTALFPNMTVLENIQYASPANSRLLVRELVEATGLDTFVNQKPARLSGGQRQRVALARALVRRPKVLLLDEPFAALDTQAGQILREVLRQLHQTWGTTTLLVSHHQVDVQALADRIIRLGQGHVQSDDQMGSERLSDPLLEPIIRIAYDETRQLWIIETTTTHLQSTNPDWEQWKVGDLIRVGK